jgi:hypothetical protein
MLTEVFYSRYYRRSALETIRAHNSHYIYVFGNHFQFKNWGEEKKEFRDFTDPLVGGKSSKNNSLPVLLRMFKSLMPRKFRKGSGAPN